MLKIEHNNKLLAIIIPHDFQVTGVNFCTPDDFSQQLAVMHHPAGHIIDAHVHNKVAREVFYTQEVLFIRKGKLEVDFYDDDRNYLESRILSAGDVIFLASGGHGFAVLEELDMVEVKQGPYAQGLDKIRFDGRKKI